jgi:cytochrome c peroxidase
MRTLTTAAVVAMLWMGCSRAPSWTAEEKEVLQDLRLTQAEPPADPSNRYATSVEAAKLGQKLFFDARFSSNGEVSCASCHVPGKQFQDGTPLAKGVGTTGRRTMPIAGVASSSWFFWDGRKDSLWSQALGPLESAVEHGGDRVQYVRLIAREYRDQYARVFGALPDLSGLPEHATPVGSGELWDEWVRLSPAKRDAVNRVFSNMGKAIAAYERKVRPGSSRFDAYVDAMLSGDATAANAALTEDEEAGLALFVGKANCVQCHNGPLFTNDDFANIGVPDARAADVGRLAGAREVLQDEFNCLGPYSDARPEQCRQLRAIHADGHARGQFKVPSLRNVAERAPYMHAGQLATLEAVLEHYNRAPAATVGESELVPLQLSAKELGQLSQFLKALSAPLATEAEWLKPREN